MCCCWCFAAWRRLLFVVMALSFTVAPALFFVSFYVAVVIVSLAVVGVCVWCCCYVGGGVAVAVATLLAVLLFWSSG